jgi:hypothetical protein
MSHGPTPAPWTLTSACPAAGAGSGRSPSFTLSIPPSCSASATRMALVSWMALGGVLLRFVMGGVVVLVWQGEGGNDGDGREAE